MARAKAAKAAIKARRPRAVPAAATLRLYRHGVGDCHLLSIPRPGGDPFHLMIDCGLLVGGQQAKLREAIQDIIDTTRGKVDVLAVTHEHWDHVSGFSDCRDLFFRPDEDKEADRRGRLSVENVWMAWTEDPRAEGAQAWERERQDKKDKLKAAAQAARLAAGGNADPIGLASMLAFYGVTPQELAAPFAAGGKVGGTDAAFEVARALAPASRRVYWRAKRAPYNPDGLPDVRVYALGPPDTYDQIRSLIRQGEVYHQEKSSEREQALALMADAVFGAAGMGALSQPAGDRAEDPYQPFDPTYGFNLATLVAPATDRAESDAERDLRGFLAAHYLDVDLQLPRSSDGWRRIDADWLTMAQPFALQLDNMTNNTSLALAVEFGADGPVLLFAADAQVGNWLSWHARSWDVDDGKGGKRRVTGESLLRRTTFYKVGHHGSHNATLKGKGVELMEDRDLAAFIPVDEAHARRHNWNHMPLPALVAALNARSSGRVLRSDRDPTDKARQAFADGTFKLRVDPRYFELSFQLPG